MCRNLSNICEFLGIKNKLSGMTSSGGNSDASQFHQEQEHSQQCVQPSSQAHTQMTTRGKLDIQVCNITNKEQ